MSDHPDPPEEAAVSQTHVPLQEGITPQENDSVAKESVSVGEAGVSTQSTSPVKRPLASSIARPGARPSTTRGGVPVNATSPRKPLGPTSPSRAPATAPRPSRLVAPTAASANKAAPASTKPAASAARPSVAPGPRTTIAPGHVRSGSVNAARGGVIAPPAGRTGVTSPARKLPVSSAVTRPGAPRPVGTNGHGTSVAPRAGLPSSASGRRTPSELNRELTEKQEELERANERVTELESKLSAKITALETAEARLEALEVTEAQLKDARDQHADALKLKDAEFDEKVQDYERRLSLGVQAADSYSSAVRQFEEKIDALEKERDDLYHQAAQMRLRNAEITATRDQHVSQIAVLQSQMESHAAVQKEREILDAQADKLRADLKEAIDATNERDQELRTLRETISIQSQADNAEVSKRVQRLQGEIDSLTVELKGSREQAQEHLTKANDAIQALQDLDQGARGARTSGHAEGLAEAAALASEREAELIRDTRSRAEQEGAAALTALRKELEEKALTDQARFDEQLRILKDTSEQVSLDLRSRAEASDQRLQALDIQHQASVEKLRERHQHELREASEQARRDASSSHIAELADIRQNSQISVDQLKASHEEVLLRERQRAQSETKELESLLSDRSSKLQSDLEASLKNAGEVSKQLAETQSTLRQAQSEQERLRKALAAATTKPVESAPSASEGRVKELEQRLAQTRAELTDTKDAMQMTQQNFAELTDNIQKDHATELERRETGHVRTHSALQKQVADLQASLAVARQTAVTSPGRPAHIDLTELHRAHASKLTEVEGEYTKNVSALRAELGRVKQELQRCQLELQKYRQDVPH